MSKRSEQAAGKIHSHALLEAEKYAASYARSIVEEAAYGRGFKTGFIEGYEQSEKDTIEIACEWLSRHYDIDLAYFRKAMEATSTSTENERN